MAISNRPDEWPLNEMIANGQIVITNEGAPMSHPIPQDELQKVMLFHNQRANKAEERIAALEAELREAKNG